MPPDFLEPTTFLDQECGSGAALGVNPAMKLLLEGAQAAIQAIYDSLSRDERIDPATGKADATFDQWCAVTGPHICWRLNAGHHSAGAAIDIDVVANPYIVTRNGTTPGGESASGLSTDDRQRLVDARNRALAVYDRAMLFMSPPAEAADVRGRQPGETTLSVWTRFKTVSDALVGYLSFAINPQLTVVNRVAIENADDLSDVDLLARIPESERLAVDFAIAQLGAFLASQDFQESHPSWPNDAREQYLRMLRDYEQVRIPMEIGNPTATPLRTRNPARGFMDLRSEIVDALCEQGLRWGHATLECRVADRQRTETFAEQSH
jgi:hypothetical protein